MLNIELVSQTEVPHGSSRWLPVCWSSELTFRPSIALRRRMQAPAVTAMKSASRGPTTGGNCDAHVRPRLGRHGQTRWSHATVMGSLSVRPATASLSGGGQYEPADGTRDNWMERGNKLPVVLRADTGAFDLQMIPGSVGSYIVLVGISMVRPWHSAASTTRSESMSRLFARPPCYPPDSTASVAVEPEQLRILIEIGTPVARAFTGQWVTTNSARVPPRLNTSGVGATSIMDCHCDGPCTMTTSAEMTSFAALSQWHRMRHGWFKP